MSDHDDLCLSPGDQPFPCLAAYGASKAALNLFINTLRQELKPWGVYASTILPSSYKTGNSYNSGKKATDNKHESLQSAHDICQNPTQMYLFCAQQLHPHIEFVFSVMTFEMLTNVYPRK